MLHCCIAKYKENVEWVNYLPCKYTIYDKGNDIPNVGRESETYLRYIIEKYDCLPENTVFLQGNPYDHIKYNNTEFLLLLDKYNNEKVNSFIPLNNILYEEHNLWSRTKESFIALFSEEVPNTFNFPPGAQFIVSKDAILARPKKFYEIIREVMANKNELKCSFNNCLVCPWTIERMWPYIFDPNIKINDISLDDLI